VPKVIDFGVAKAVDQRLTERTMFTQLGQVVGTIDYMSPEQAKLNQLDIDTRSDIYSLGVLLYELLTGETPFDKQRLRSAAFDELLRIIREEEPPRPSERLSTCETLPSVAANRHIEPRKLSTLVRGELDWIVMKALEKDRNRRYETANRLVEDIHHYLNDEPVIACPPSAAYRFRKFARRNKVAIATTTAVALSLIVGAGVATWQAVRATRAASAERESREYADRERNRAVAAEQLAGQRLETEQQQRERAEQAEQAAKDEEAIAKAVNDFLNGDLLGMADAASQLEQGLAANRDMKLRTVVDRAAEKIEGRFEDQPLVEAAIRTTIGWTYLNLGMHEEAERHLKRAHELREAALGADHAATLTAACNLSCAYGSKGWFEQARALAQETLDRSRVSLGPEHPITLASMERLGGVLIPMNAFTEAERLFREILEIRQRHLAADPSDSERARILWVEHDLANLLICTSRASEAEELYRSAFEYSLSTYGPEHPHTLCTKGNVAKAISVRGRDAEAEKLLREVVDEGRRIWGPAHRATLWWEAILGRVVLKQGRASEAEAMLRTVLELQRDALGPEHKFTLETTLKLAESIEAQGRREEAQSLVQETLDRIRHLIEPENLATKNAAAPLTQLWRKRCAEFFRSGDWQAADELARKAVELAPEHAGSWAILGTAQYRVGNWQAAVEAFERADSLREDDDHHDRFVLAMACWRLGRRDEACRHYLETTAWLYAGNRPAEQYQLRDEAERLIAPEAIVDHCTTNFDDEPTSSAWRWQRGAAHARSGDLDAAAADFLQTRNLAGDSGWNERTPAFRALMHCEPVFDRLAELRPAVKGRLWLARGRYYARCACWEVALVDYQRALGSPRPDGLFAENAYLLLLADDVDGYCDMCRQLADEFGATDNVHMARHLAFICALDFRTDVDPQRIVAWAEPAVAANRNKFTLHVLAMACYRAGEFERTVELVEESLREHQGHESNLAALLALSYLRLGREEDARTWYDRAETHFKRGGPSGQEAPVGFAIGHWLNMALWRREAVAAFDNAHYDPRTTPDAARQRPALAATAADEERDE
jgi:tetratricopeptide (TPR) repeat protein